MRLFGWIRRAVSLGRSCAYCHKKPVNTCATCHKRICAECSINYHNSTVCKRCAMTISQDVRAKKTKDTSMSKEDIETELFKNKN